MPAFDLDSQVKTGWDRRQFVLGLGYVSALMTTTPGSVVAGDAHAVVDVHHHIAPPSMMKLAAERGVLPPALADLSIARALEDMDRAGVTTAFTSISWPGVHFDGPANAIRLARESNEFAAEQVHQYPGRFGMFATLPLPDIDESLREAAFALDELNADGVHMWTSYADRWLGHPHFDPLMAELNRRRVTVYVHPSTPACCASLVADVPVGVVEYGTDTTRTIASLLFSGVAAKYPGIAFIFSHAGGTAPFLVERMLLQAKKPEVAARLPHGVLHELGRFYYETAQSANRWALASLRELVPVSQILFGSDFPYRTCREQVLQLEATGLFAGGQLRAIHSGNAQRLFPRLRAK